MSLHLFFLLVKSAYNNVSSHRKWRFLRRYVAGKIDLNQFKSTYF
ncbi:hypothetical protein Q676_18070 [Escherichia coli N40607]|nr:hypothetical protein Q676_18070 [Escherichia coli N40607]